MGRMDADFHCFRTTDEDSNRFITADNGAAKNGMPIRKNQREYCLTQWMYDELRREC